MRLLYYFWGNGDGGDATGVIELARAMVAAGQTVTLAAYAFVSPEAFRQRALLAGLPEPIFVSDPALAFEEGLDRGDFDLIHVHHGTPVPKRTDIVALRKMAGGLPMVFTAHGPTPLSEITYGGLKSRISRMISPSWFKAIIVPSEAKAAEWRKMTPLARNVVAIPPVMRFFERIDRSEARKKFGLPNDAEIALFCSRLDTEKNPMSFIKAIEAAARPNLVGLMSGRGGLCSECEAYIASKNAPVSLMGYVDDIESLYSTADVFVQCSAHESFCITLLHAVALGLPCVASDIPVFRDTYRGIDSIAFCDGGNEGEIAKRLNRLLDSPPDTGGQLRIKEQYSEATVVDRHLTLYRKVLGL